MLQHLILFEAMNGVRAKVSSVSEKEIFTSSDMESESTEKFHAKFREMFSMFGSVSKLKLCGECHECF